MWSPRIQSLYEEGLTIEQALELVESRAERAGKAVKKSLMVALFIAAIIGTIAQLWSGGASDLDHVVPGLGIALAAATVLVAVLQIVDEAWSKAPIGQYRRLFDWFIARLTRSIRHRGTARVLARYGRQELAEKALPKEAEKYSVATYVKYRRRRRIVCSSAASALIVAGGVAAYALSSEPAPHYHVGQQFSLDNGFSAQVLGKPQCGQTDPQNLGPYCSVEVRFQDITHFPYILSSGNFTSFGPAEVPAASDTGYNYALAMESKGNDYNLITAMDSTFSDEVNSGQQITFDLYFGVPSGVHPDELLFNSETTSATEYVDLP